MQIELLTLLGLASLGWLFVYAEPLILTKRNLGFKDELFDTYSPIKQYIHKLIYCEICSTFWIAFGCLIVMNYCGWGLLLGACISSVISGLINKIINN